MVSFLKHKFYGSGGGIRTHDQLVTPTPLFRMGVDYLIIHADAGRFPLPLQEYFLAE